MPPRPSGKCDTAPHRGAPSHCNQVNHFSRYYRPHRFNVETGRMPVTLFNIILSSSNEDLFPMTNGNAFLLRRQAECLEARSCSLAHVFLFLTLLSSSFSSLHTPPCLCAS